MPEEPLEQPEPQPDPDPQLMPEEPPEPPEPDEQPAPPMPEEPPAPDPQPSMPAPQPMPEERPEPPATGPAPVAPVRAHTLTRGVTDPQRRARNPYSSGWVNLYRMEELEALRLGFRRVNPRMASSWENGEYRGNPGLGLIRASTGYAARTTGRPGGGGVTIAIVGRRIPVDDGASFGHYDLEGVTQARIVTSHPPAPDLDHETQVAGIAAARRNGVEMHGVAYNANIVSVPQSVRIVRGTRIVRGATYLSWDMEAILASTAGLSRSFYSTFGGNFRSNPAASAHVANLSLLVPIRFTQTTIRGMRHMAQAGRVMVAALGNDGKPNPTYAPASRVGRPGIAGHAIAVGALDATGDAAAPSSAGASSPRAQTSVSPAANTPTTRGGTGPAPARPSPRRT